MSGTDLDRTRGPGPQPGQDRRPHGPGIEGQYTRESDRKPAASISTPRARVMQRKGFRDPDPGEDPLVGMTAAGPAGTPAVPRGAAGPPRPGWPAMYLWLVSALVGWGPPIEAITRISVTWQRIRPTRGVVPNTLPITAVLAGLAVKAAGHAEKVLVNRCRALRRASTVLTRWLVPSTIAALPGSAAIQRTGAALTPIDTASDTGPAAPNRTTEEPEPGPQATGSRPTAWKIAGPAKKTAKQDQ